MLKIYGRDNSINVRKVLWLCAELELPYERYDFGRGFQPTDTPEFLALSQYGVVPVIDDEGFVLRESNTIVRYLAEKHASGDIYPRELQPRAQIQAWMDWASTDLGSAMRSVFWGVQLKHPDFTDPKQIEVSLANWTRQMRRLDAHLAEGNAHLMGTAFTVADIPVGLTVNRWFCTDIERPQLSSVSAYYDRLSLRPAFRQHGRNGTP